MSRCCGGKGELDGPTLGGALEALTLVGTRVVLSLGGALEELNWTVPAGTKVSWTVPAGTKVSWTGPAEAKVSWTRPAEAKVSWTNSRGRSGALTLVGARAALTLVGALESWTEPAETKMSWAGPAEELESTCEEPAPEGAGEEQAPGGPWRGAGTRRALARSRHPEGPGEEQALEGAGDDQALEGAGEEQALGLGSKPSPLSNTILWCLGDP